MLPPGCCPLRRGGGGDRSGGSWRRSPPCGRRGVDQCFASLRLGCARLFRLTPPESTPPPGPTPARSAGWAGAPNPAGVGQGHSVECRRSISGRQPAWLRNRPRSAVALFSDSGCRRLSGASAAPALGGAALCGVMPPEVVYQARPGRPRTWGGSQVGLASIRAARYSPRGRGGWVGGRPWFDMRISRRYPPGGRWALRGGAYSPGGRWGFALPSPRPGALHRVTHNRRWRPYPDRVTPAAVPAGLNLGSRALLGMGSSTSRLTRSPMVGATTMPTPPWRTGSAWRGRGRTSSMWAGNPPTRSAAGRRVAEEIARSRPRDPGTVEAGVRVSIDTMRADTAAAAVAAGAVVINDVSGGLADPG